MAVLSATAQTQLTTTEAQSLFQTTTKARVSIHDPSVVYHESQQRYYIFGSHKVGAYTRDMKNWTAANPIWRTATTYNASNADAFVTPAVKQVTKGGQSVSFPAFNAKDWSARNDAGYNIDGNMWAPDVIYNPVMKKWCYYLSINGNDWHSSIILLTSDNITGPYLYQGPVVTSGFYDTQHSYKETDLELAIGTQSSLPGRYNVGSNWGKRWPHTIDPAVFYDADGNVMLIDEIASGNMRVYKDGEYYLSEINPRFGGAYLHAYAAGVDFIKLIENNVEDIPNKEEFGNYEEDVVMMMYDSIVFKKKEEMIIQ